MIRSNLQLNILGRIQLRPDGSRTVRRLEPQPGQRCLVHRGGGSRLLPAEDRRDRSRGNADRGCGTRRCAHRLQGRLGGDIYRRKWRSGCNSLRRRRRRRILRFRLRHCGFSRLFQPCDSPQRLPRRVIGQSDGSRLARTSGRRSSGLPWCFLSPIFGRSLRITLMPKMKEISVQKPDRRAGEHECGGRCQQQGAYRVGRTPPGLGIAQVRLRDRRRKRSLAEDRVVLGSSRRVQQGIDDRVDAAHLKFSRFTRRRIGLTVRMQHFRECPVRPPDVPVIRVRSEAQFVVIIHHLSDNVLRKLLKQKEKAIDNRDFLSYSEGDFISRA